MDNSPADARAFAAAALLEQAARLARAGAFAEADALVKAAQALFIEATNRGGAVTPIRRGRR